MKSLRYNRDGYGMALVVCLVVTVLLMVISGIVVSKHQPKARLPASQTASQSATTPVIDSLMVLEYRGGLCPDGHECVSRYSIYSDGTFEGHSRLGTAEVTKLHSLIEKSDFSQYSRLANDSCASDSDGQDEILSFPQKYPDKSFRLCELDIPVNEPTIRYIDSLIRLHD